MKRILVVDDYEDIHSIFSFVFQDDNVELRFLSDPAGLDELLMEWNPDLLLLDVRLGSVDGRDICRLIKADQRFVRLKVVLMSALSIDWKDDLSGADLTICKPFDIFAVSRDVLYLIKSNGSLDQ